MDAGLSQVSIAAASSLCQQGFPARFLDTVDRKINLHRRKHGVFEELFKVLLNKLMTGEVGMRQLDLAAFGGDTG